jgi:PPOX class probable F420-dependent enzyme
MPRKFATADVVTLPELLDFIRPRHRMVLTTFRADGSLQSSPVTGGVDDAGRIVIASYPQRAKSANIRRSRRASVTVLSDEFNGP